MVTTMANNALIMLSPIALVTQSLSHSQSPFTSTGAKKRKAKIRKRHRSKSVKIQKNGMSAKSLMIYILIVLKI